jgi:hypothetical protein
VAADVAGGAPAAADPVTGTLGVAMPGAQAPLDLARVFLDDARAGRSDDGARAALAALDPAGLAAALPDDPSRIAFWLNVYNAAVRSRLLADPARYRRRWRFFASPSVTVAGRTMSPNAIEHGILRRSAFTLGLGYVNNPFPSSFEHRLRVEQVDPRVHFALNCGARSCPPLAAWDPATLEVSLERATSAYLASESRRSADGREVSVPRLLLWYRGDFGGGSGIRALLRRHGVIGATETPGIRYADYDWSLDLDDTAR